MEVGDLIVNSEKIISFDTNEPVNVIRIISTAGGQGDVYYATYRNKEYALKWYCKNDDDVIGGPQYKTIKNIVEKRPSDKFIWPAYMVKSSNNKNNRFGYLMPLIPDGYYEMERFQRMDDDEKAVRFMSYNALLSAAMNLATCMRKLHLKGFSYKDLNPNNLAIHPETGDVLIIDNDNVSCDGDLCTVRGMKGFMAPEIPRSNYRVNPSTKTDYYSLAVVLYQLFFIDHPMDGKLFEKFPLITDDVEELLYAKKPVFHYNPNSDINRPTEVYAPNALVRWNRLPLKEIKKMFVLSFTEGINNPEKRFTENVWITAISRCRDRLVRVQEDREQFVVFEKAASIPKGCLGMKMNSGAMIAIYPKKAIFQISIDRAEKKYLEMSGGIVYLKDKRMLAIKNFANYEIEVTYPQDEKKISISKGETAPLVPGAKIQFGPNANHSGIIFDAKNNAQKIANK